MGNFLNRPLFCIWLYAIAPNHHTEEDLLFPPSDATAYASRWQLMMQPQGRWVQRLDKTNTGVTVVASRVSRKLSDSKGRLWKPTICWTTMWICKGESFRHIPASHFHFPRPFPQACCPRLLFLAPSLPESRSSAPGLAPLALVVVSWDLRCSRQNRTLGVYTPECLILPAASSGLHQGGTVHNGELGCYWENGQVSVQPGTPDGPLSHPWNVTSVQASCHRGCCPGTSQLGSLWRLE